MYRLTLLGGVLLEGPEGPVEGRATQQRRLALLALAGSAGERGRSRDQLISFLWPETGAREARQRLSHSIYEIRKSLGEEAVRSAGEFVRLSAAHVEVDAVAFEHALQAGDREAAVHLYAGPFMDGFFIEEAPEFERWVDSERRRLASLYTRSLEELARDAGDQGDQAAATGWWGALVAHDPYNSAAVVHLMEAHASAGDPANAVQLAQDHIRLLEDEFGMRPPEEVVAKLGELKGRRRRWSSGGATAPIDLGAHEAAGGTTAEAATRASATRRLVRRVVLTSLAVATGLAIAWPTFRSSSRGVESFSNAVMVRAVQNLSGNPSLDDVGRYATYVLEGSLAGIDTVRVVTAAEADNTRTAIEQVRSMTGPDLTREMARQTRAGLVVEASFVEHADSLFLEARLIDAVDGEVLEGWEAGSPVSDPMPAIKAVGDRLLVAIATRLELGEQYASSYGRGQSYPAWQLVDAARKLYVGRGREREALALLHEALAVDSTFDSAVGLAMIWHMNFGEYSRADSLSRVLEDRIELIPPRQRWQLAVNKAVLRRDRERMLQAFRDWRDRLPNRSRWMHLADAEWIAQRPAACLEALGNVDSTEGSGKLWALYAASHHALGNDGESLRYALLGRDRFPEDLAVAIAAARALAVHGRADEASLLVDEHLSEPAERETFDHENRFRLLVEPGLELQAHGFAEAGREALDRAVAWYRAKTLGPASHNADRWRLARALYAAGRWPEAREAFSALSPEDLVGDTRLLSHNIDVSLLGYQATLAVRLGDHQTADRIDAQLSRMTRPYLWGHATYWRAAMAAVRGDGEAAVALLRRAMDQGLFAQPWGTEYPKWDYHVDPDFESVRDYRPFAELIAPRA